MHETLGNSCTRLRKSARPMSHWKRKNNIIPPVSGRNGRSHLIDPPIMSRYIMYQSILEAIKNLDVGWILP